MPGLNWITTQKAAALRTLAMKITPNAWVRFETAPPIINMRLPLAEPLTASAKSDTREPHHNDSKKPNKIYRFPSIILHS